ncbi:hypothetical protein AJ88_18725 [Mesorhizobium amorphae CCBAU 01583]|nr:hypothetical protein AJ88_18725 [Mesorhizobium amorphae CCBAU 01583]
MLYVQKDVEKKMLEMLKGAMEALNLGNPWQISTDVGPVIDDEAQASIGHYCTKMGLQGRLIAKLEAPKNGRFVAPHVFRVKGIEEMEREVFGPVLHVATFDADEIDAVIAAINRKGYGLTFGLHTRIEGASSISSTASMPATSMSTATRSAPLSARSRSAARGFPAPARRPAARII